MIVSDSLLTSSFGNFAAILNEVDVMTMKTKLPALSPVG